MVRIIHQLISGNITLHQLDGNAPVYCCRCKWENILAYYNFRHVQ